MNGFFQRGKNTIDKIKMINEENRRAKENAPLPLVILNDGMPLFVVIAYLLMGFLANPPLWHPGWIILFVIPVYYAALESVKHKSAEFFPVPIIILAVYLLLGFGFGLWHPYWVIFAAIPVYYAALAVVKTRSLQRLFDVFVPILVIAAYLMLGLLGNLWHPGWVVFFIIPLYYQITASVKKYNRRKRAQDDSVYPHDGTNV